MYLFSLREIGHDPKLITSVSVSVHLSAVYMQGSLLSRGKRLLNWFSFAVYGKIILCLVYKVISDTSNGDRAERIKNPILCGLELNVTNEVDYKDPLYFLRSCTSFYSPERMWL